MNHSQFICQFINWKASGLLLSFVSFESSENNIHMKVFVWNKVFSSFGWYPGFPDSSNGKESACSVGDLGLIPGLGTSSGERHGDLLQYSCLENAMDRRTWWAAVHELQRVGHNWVTDIFRFPGKGMNSFARNCSSFFHRDCSIQCFHQQWMRVPVAPHPQQHSLWSVFWTLAILIDV